MIDYDYSDLFLQDAVTKEILITDGTIETIGDDWVVSLDATVLVTNAQLETESFELHQSLNSEMQLRFGSCESAYISFTFHPSGNGDTETLKGKTLRVYIIPNHQASKMLQLGIFKVQEDKLTNDRRGRKITAYDAMYDIINSDVADWYNNNVFMPIPMVQPTTTMALFRALFIGHFGLEAEETTLVNDSITIHKTINPETLSGADVIKAICEINGVFGQITNEGKFRFVELPEDIKNDPDDLVTDIDVPNYIDVEYEDYDSKAITGVYIITSKGSRYRSSTSVTPRNTYTINGNFLIADYRGEDLYNLAGRLVTKMVNRYYLPLTVNAIGSPAHEVGDPIRVLLKDGSALYTYILERNFKGVQALRDTYTARGEEEAGESLNSISSRYTQLENNAIQAATEAATVASTTDFVEVIRNIGFRLLDEPTDVTAEFDTTNLQVELTWTDPDDIATLEPVPCTWAGTIVVRKKDSAPRHKWDGVLITDSTTRDQYANAALVDGNIAPHRTYFYGIFPYHVALDDLENPIKHYRYTKAVKIETGEAETIQTLLNTSESFVSDLFDDLRNEGQEIWTPDFVIETSGEYINALTRLSSGTNCFCYLDCAFSKGEATKMYVDAEGTPSTNAWNFNPSQIYGGLVKAKPTNYSDGWNTLNNNSWKTTAFADLPPRSTLERTRFEVSLEDVQGNFYIMFQSLGFQTTIIREISFDAPIIVKG